MELLHKRVGYAGQYVLFALFKNGPLHGYAVMKAVPDITGGSTRLSIANVYSALGRLLDLGLVELRDEGAFTSSTKGPPKKVYRLTGEGSRVVEHELSRTRRMLDGLEGARPSSEGAAQ